METIDSYERRAALKLSIYIEELKKILEKHGDIDCVKWIENDDYDSTTDGWYEAMTYTQTLSYLADRIDEIGSYKDTEGEKQYCTSNMFGYIDCNREKAFVIKETIKRD